MSHDRMDQQMDRCIAVLNAGSSSIKFAAYRQSEPVQIEFRGRIERIAIAPTLSIVDKAGEQIEERSWPAEGFDHRAATNVIIETIVRLLNGTAVAGVAHRVVHGGTEFDGPVLVTSEILQSLGKLSPLAPLHQPHNLAPIAAIREAAPNLPQIACFDTAFHQSQPALAQMFALPREMTSSGIRRYGFHGLSYDFVSRQLAELAPDLASGRVIIAHLGNGSSLCALRAGRSVATTMGFTAVDGLMMGTRCGSVDPGVILYLMDERGMSPREIEDLIYRRSGLLGVSGITSDMQSLRASTEAGARDAIDLFVYRIVREIGSLAAALEGLDGLVFTGGIGERDTRTRSEVVRGCAWLGARLDEDRNAQGEGKISATGSSIDIRVVPTDEERMMAQQAAALLPMPVTSDL